MNDFKVGDPVEVLDHGLLSIQRFAPSGAFPNNWGIINEISSHECLIEFPIGEDPMDEHSQVAPYPMLILRKLKGKNAEKMLARKENRWIKSR